LHALVYDETVHAVHMLKRSLATLMSVSQGGCLPDIALRPTSLTSPQPEFAAQAMTSAGS
jgi:hypothetical protein